MVLNGNTKVVIQAIAIIGSLMGLGTWLRADITANTYRTEMNATALNEMNITFITEMGKLNANQQTMLETLKWLQRQADDYQKKNGTMNLNGFFEYLSKNK